MKLSWIKISSVAHHAVVQRCVLSVMQAPKGGGALIVGTWHDDISNPPVELIPHETIDIWFVCLAFQQLPSDVGWQLVDKHAHPMRTQPRRSYDGTWFAHYLSEEILFLIIPAESTLGLLYVAWWWGHHCQWGDDSNANLIGAWVSLASSFLADMIPMEICSW